MRLMLQKVGPDMLRAADAETVAAMKGIKTGDGLSVEARKARNIRFHKKGFALLQFAFEHWEPAAAEYKGQAVAKEFDRFRKDITILAGFYRPVYNVRGEVRPEADSLSFASMDDARFAEVYKAILDVIWKRILTQYQDAQEIDDIVNQLMSYQ